MSHSFPKYTLIYHSRNGSLNFEELVEELSSKGYMLETELSFLRPTYNAASNEDFKKLFEFYYPQKINRIELQTIGTSAGGIPGNNTYAFYNANIISHKEILEMLTEFNQQSLDE
ncbi:MULTISPECIES: hypothetical protein [Acinetobacter]|uniref:Uncharacterized protein n=2 Tax=Acinetobacter TaxID=469 RepID=N9D6Q6_9GAMM|nr:MULTISPECIES: hypothetical protein [Acinetobacter]APU47939.1 hypothetical protein BVL33_05180 [Acinetobacter junii]ENV78344.1 hypothetical protein F942_03000 [Acinetobacter ursingii ANC 3649]QXZ24320.1 hypothetical protein I6L31_06120 [Acinetobacter septicus]TIE06467.1 hypothetical protein DIZ70_02790 [Acinetobacter junii]